MISKNRKRYAVAASITKKQINVIMLICAQFGISKEQRSELLLERYKQSSTADLNTDQAGHFIKEFEGKGFKLINQKPSGAIPRTTRPRIQRAGGNVIALASQDELGKVRAVADLILWRADNGLRLFLEKRMGIKEGKVRTSKDAWLAIEGLKKMFENQMKRLHGSEWKTKRYASEPIMEYIAIHRALK